MLAASDLVAAARAATGLEDFGDPGFREGLEVLCDSLGAEARLNDVGRMAHEWQLGNYLAERLRVEDWWRRHPEIGRQAIEGPLCVVGLPRTGTTALAHLLAADPDTRSLRMWESQQPTPPPESATYGSDPRIAEADARNAPLRSNPEFVRMYDGTATSPTENIDLLGQHFRTQHFEGMARIPSYIRWWQGCDMVPAYRHLARVLRLLQWRCPPTRWHLKSPPDLGCLDAIVEVFPGARFVWTHRDPARVLASVCRLISFIRRMQSDDVDDRELGREQLAVWSEAMRRGLAARRRLGEERFADITLRDTALRPVETIAAAYARLDLPFTAEAERRMREWAGAHRQHQHGATPGTLAEFGLDADEVREAFRGYIERFGIEIEPGTA